MRITGYLAPAVAALLWAAPAGVGPLPAVAAQEQVDTRAVMRQYCVNCHSTIHGSNHPAGGTFLR